MFKHFTPGIKGKVALVTGASRGIGKATALALAEQGASVVLHARNRNLLDEVRRQIESCGGDCFTQVCDVRDEDSINKSIASIESTLQASVDILINNAGIYATAPVLNHPLDVWEDSIKTNLTGPFLYARAVLPPMMQKQWGRVINVSSISGRVGEIHAAAYSASKFGLIGFTQSLALETASRGITVNAVCPGWVDTDMARRQLGDENWCKLNAVDADHSLEIARLSVPQMRFIQPSEVADLIVWLCSDAARGITGQSYNICGGMCLS